MIDPRLYNTVYLIFVAILTMMCSVQYGKYSNARLSSWRPVSVWPIICLACAVCLFIGLRPISGVFVDMINYDVSYALYRGRVYQFSLDRTNYIFDNLFLYFAASKYAIQTFFLIVAIIYFGGIAIACRRLFPKDGMYAFVIYLGGLSTFSYATNGVKAGAAAALFLLAISFYDKKIVCVALLLLSLGFHHSMVMPIAAFTGCCFCRKPKVYIWVWVITLLLAVGHITYFQALFGGMADEQGAGYLAMDNSGYRTGFRLDFVIYSAVPVVLGYYIMDRLHYRSKVYSLIYGTYVLANAGWMLCMYASFTNRIAYLSWFMLPVVLVYPFFDKQFIRHQYQKLNVVAWFHLGFTLFMETIYYGLIKG